MEIVLIYHAQSECKLGVAVHLNNDRSLFYDFKKWSTLKKTCGGVQIFPGKPTKRGRCPISVLDAVKRFKEEMGTPSMTDALMYLKSIMPDYSHVEQIVQNRKQKEFPSIEEVQLKEKSLDEVIREENASVEELTLNEKRICWALCLMCENDGTQKKSFKKHSSLSKNIAYNCGIGKKNTEAAFKKLRKMKILIPTRPIGKLVVDIEKCRKMFTCDEAKNFKPLKSMVGFDIEAGENPTVKQIGEQVAERSSFLVTLEKALNEATKEKEALCKDMDAVATQYCKINNSIKALNRVIETINENKQFFEV